MLSPPTPLVWFLLLDSATGLPYKGTNADKVSVSSSADMVDDELRGSDAGENGRICVFVFLLDSLSKVGDICRSIN